MGPNDLQEVGVYIHEYLIHRLHDTLGPRDFEEGVQCKDYNFRTRVQRIPQRI